MNNELIDSIFEDVKEYPIMTQCMILKLAVDRDTTIADTKTFYKWASTVPSSFVMSLDWTKELDKTMRIMNSVKNKISVEFFIQFILIQEKQLQYILYKIITERKCDVPKTNEILYWMNYWKNNEIEKIADILANVNKIERREIKGEQ